jgi:peptide/nickel transport system substrate-binding protein
MRRRRPSRPAAVLAALATSAAGGCGSVSPSVGGAGALPAPTGSLVLALPGHPGTLDPLLAASPYDQLLVRQIDEPLVERVSGPYDDVRSFPGPATAVRPAGRATQWRARLRPGIRFQDGTRLDAAAVLANAARWRTTAAGQALLPGLAAVDSPRPDLVRFFLDRPDPGFAHRLASPRLGLVSPRAMSVRTGEGATLSRSSGTGTGPFELRQRSAHQVVIARNSSWWGSRRRLGPGLDSIELRYGGSAGARARLLLEGQVQVAAGLEHSRPGSLQGNPLIDVQRGALGVVASERSVRGLEAGGVPSLSGVWLTTIAAG